LVSENGDILVLPDGAQVQTEQLPALKLSRFAYFYSGHRKNIDASNLLEYASCPSRIEIT